MPSVSYRCFQLTVVLSILILCLKFAYEDLWTIGSELILIIMGFKAMMDQTIMLYWTYTLANLFYALISIAILTGDNEDGKNKIEIPPVLYRLIIYKFIICVVSSFFAWRIANKLQKRGMIQNGYMAPDGCGRLVYIKSESINDMKESGPVNLPYYTVDLSNTSYECFSDWRSRN